MDKMKKEIKARWVAALRSGEYEQSKNFLKGEYGFCCLGVLCDILQDDLGGEWDEDSFMGVSEFLPGEIMEYCGLTDSDPELVSKGQEKGISFFNDAEDDFHLTFAELADAIEVQL